MRKFGAAMALVALAACSRPKGTAPPQPKSRPAVNAAPTVIGRGTDVGSAMPPYSAKLLDGKTFDVGTEKGQVVLINVWATWCEPCRFEIPELQTLHNKYAGRGFKVVGVSVDETGADVVKQFVDENKITYPIVLDADGRIANLLRTTVLPTSVIIGRNGKIIWRKIGAVMPNETASVDAVVERALTPKKS